MGACKRYVVFSPCRTGSTIIVNNLSTDITNTVIHMHNPEWTPYRDDFICILSKRKDRFATVLSHAVMDTTGEIHNYSNTLEPFEIDTARFKRLYLSHLHFYKQIQLNCYQQVVEVWYDELISDPRYLFKQLGQRQRTNYSTISKSPYDYAKLILNYDHLKQIANNMDQLLSQ